MKTKKEIRKTLLITPSECKTLSMLSTNVDDAYITSAILNAQEIYLPQIIGTNLYYKLQELISNQINKEHPGIYDNDYAEYDELWSEYVKPVIKSRVILDLIYNLSYKIRNIGVVKNSDTNVNYSDRSELNYLTNQYGVYFNNYCDRLSKFIKANKLSYPELEADVPDYYERPNFGKNYANDGGLWLGSDHKNKCGC